MTQHSTTTRSLDSLATRDDCTVLRPGDTGYNDARQVWNAAIDKRPAAIVRAQTTSGVASAVRAARELDLPVAVRCGGHSVAGKSICDDGLLIDLAPMKRIDIDVEGRVADVGGGVLWGELDQETQAHGLATPGGRVSTTGVGGFTLGGGYGWLSPMYGLACDNLLAAEVVTADGEVVRADEAQNPDLLWGLRGGGGNFGVVTSYRFQLHPVGPTVVGGMLMHPLEDAGEVLRIYREYVEQAPDELATAFALFPAPPEPFIPEHLQNRTVLGIIACHCGTVAQGTEALRSLKAIGTPAVDLVGPMPYTALQTLLDPTAPRGWRWYNTGDHLRELDDEAIDALVAHAPQGLDPLTQAIVFRHGGAVSRVPDDDTAFGNRQHPYLLHPLAAWREPEDENRHVTWLRELVADLTPYTTGGVYLNFAPDDKRIVDGYGHGKYQRLAALKDRYDPDNVFRFNHNIHPSAAGVVR